MDKLEKAYYTIMQMETRSNQSPSIIDPRINVVISLVFLIVMLSVPLGRLSSLIWFALYPMAASAVLGISFGKIFSRSLYVLPLVVLIGIFNPLLDKIPVFRIGGFVVTSGWLSFMSIIVRGLLAMQCILILIDSCGFQGICRAFRKLGVPAFLTDQLMFVYRYISVLLLEALTMKRAREARGYGRKSYPLKLWGTLTGQLFLRAIDRSERINKAMLARGFNGTFPSFSQNANRLTIGSWAYLLLMGGGIIALRIINISSLFGAINP